MTQPHLTDHDEEEKSAALRLVLADVDAAIWRSAASAIPTALLLAGIYCRWASLPGTVYAVALVTASMIPYYLWMYLRSTNRATLSVRSLAIANAIGCIAWAATPWLMMPDKVEAQFCLVAIAFAIMIANVADSAALRPVYLVGQIPMIVILSLGFAIGADGTARLLWLPIVLAGAYIDNVARPWGKKAIESARLRVQNEHLVGELRETNTVLRYRSSHDHLTGLPNREAFSSYVNTAISEAKNGADRCIAVILIDLDGFKAVNDNLGHQAGDQLLIETASRLRICTPEQAIVARLGGDEMAIAWSGDPTRDDVGRLATMVNETLRDPIQAGAGHVRISASVGIVLDATPADTSETQLLHQADVALYAAKAAGKDGHVFFRSDLPPADATERTAPIEITGPSIQSV